MTTPARQRLTDVLGDLDLPGEVSARRSIPSDALHIEIRGIGPLQLPVTAQQARSLRAVARPAAFGQGEHTLVDSRVRDTWQVPKARITIDKRRWHAALRPVLEQLRADLGLPDGSTLAPELHSMLVYGPGQFFAPHQDSEKGDGMVATLVVVLPGSSKGGALIVEHAGQRKAYRASRELIALIAFYADCRHEVRPVTSGYRVTLTYNLRLRGSEANVASAGDGTRSALARCLHEHFDSEDRLVYLLDHQYSQRSLRWAGLKGADARRAQALREAAPDADCVVALATTQVHQVWQCYPDEIDSYRWGSQWDDEEYWDDDSEDPEDHEVGELIDSDMHLDHWIVDEPGARLEKVAVGIGEDELCGAPLEELEPDQSEYEGYMGNYGNTMDRWYHRAAVVIWPRRDDFAVRGQASPGWALRTLADYLQDGNLSHARELAAAMTQTWVQVVRPILSGPDGDEAGRKLLTQTVSVAAALKDRTLSAALLRPFRTDLIAADAAPALARLATAYGADAVCDVLATWSGSTPWAGESSRLTWMDEVLPAVCAASRDLTDPAGEVVAGLLLRDSWDWLQGVLRTRRRLSRPTVRDEALVELAPAITVLLQAAGADLRDTMLPRLKEGDDLLGVLMHVQRLTADTPDRIRPASGLHDLARHCIQRLEARLSAPQRSPEDWSIPAPTGCDCPLCCTLDDFLADPEQHSLEWPIAKQKRQHVHQRLDSHELPVRHQTRRKGSPYTLVLTKTRDLFDREIDARRRDQADLDWLTKRG